MKIMNELINTYINKVKNDKCGNYYLENKDSLGNAFNIAFQPINDEAPKTKNVAL